MNPADRDESTPPPAGPNATSDFFGPSNFAPSTFATTTLVVLASLYTLYFAADFLIPIAAAFLLNLLLSPVVRYLERFHIPPPAGAGIVVVTMMALIFLAFYALAQPAAEWLKRGPTIIYDLQERIEEIKRPVQNLRSVAEDLEKAARMERPGAAPDRVAVRDSDFISSAMEIFQSLTFYLAITGLLLIFLLAAGDLFKEKLVKAAPRLQDKKQVILLIRQVEADVAAYLGTITAINICLGIAIGTAMYVIGLPNAILWGAMAMLLNFIPYLGAIAGALVVAVVALASLDSVEYALIAPAAYMLLNALEGSVITPAILGRRLTLNPVVIIVALTFWAWIWGVAGALMAIPLLVTLRVVSEHVERLNTIGEFLSGRGNGNDAPPANDRQAG